VRLLLFGFFLLALAPSLQATSNAVPLIDQPISPASARPGTHGLTLTIKGIGFVSGSVAQWNGQNLATTFVSGGVLSAIVPASSLLHTGAAVVTVANPAPGGGVSNPQFFEITWPTPTEIMFEIRTNTSGTTQSLVAGDFNGDGRLDFAENNPNPAGVGGIKCVSVQTQSAVAFYPALITFPPQTVGTTSAPKTMRFKNVGIAPLNISKAQVLGYYSGTNDCPATLAVGAHCTATITFTPGFVGLSGGVFQVNDDALGVVQNGGFEGRGK